MTDPLTAVTAAADTWRRSLTDRDEAIRRARERGASLRAIADAAGLSHTAVAKVLARVTPPTPQPDEPAVGR